jgi:MFS family permease
MWLTWELTHSGVWLGAMSIGEIVPYIVFAPIAGAISDHFDRLRIARVAQLAATAVPLALTAFAFAGGLTVELLLVFVMLSGGVETFWSAARLAMTPNMVPKEDVGGALSIGAMSFNVSVFVGPALFGLVITTLDVAWAFAFNTLMCGMFFVALHFVRLMVHERQTRRAKNFFAEIAEGVGYTFRHPGISIMLPMMFMSSICLRGYRDLLAGISDTVYFQGAHGLAMLLAATGIGAIVSSLYLGNVARVKGLTFYIIANQAAAVAAITLFGLVNFFWVGLLCSAALGWTITTIGIGSQILLQTAMHGEMRGRVMSLWSINARVGPAIGALTAGTLSEWWGFQLPLMVLALVFVLPLAYLYRRRKHIASYMEVGPDEAPGAQPKANPNPRPAE